MPVFKRHLTVAARGVRAFLNLEAGVMRDDGAVPGPRTADLARRGLAKLRAKKQTGSGVRVKKLASSDANTEAGGVRPENIVWIFGSGRSGSTWLSSMMEDVEGHARWREPNVGFLFGYVYYVWAHEGQRGAENFILGRYKESWLRSVRNFVLDAARIRFPALSEDEYLVIKEPNGSIGAPLLMEALPESRMVLLVRDPRDVVASYMDARRIGGWSYERLKDKKLYLEERKVSVDRDPDAFVEWRTKDYLEWMGRAKEAYDAHRGRKVLVRYEDLRADTLETMKRIYASLEISVDEEELARVVEKHSWENIPEDKKGEGRFYRKATPGGWREDLTPEQAETVERITAPLLREFYPYEGQSESPPEKPPLNWYQKYKIFGA